MASALNLPLSNIAVIDDFSLAADQWIRSGAVSEFDVIFNAGGKKAFACGVQHLSALGSYIHNQGDEAPEIPSGSPSTHTLDINRIAAASPAFLAPVVSAVLQAHASQPFKLRSRVASMSAFSGSQSSGVDSVVVVPEVVKSVRVDPSGQLFDPRKAYILVGGCSELGVRITEWMAIHGARHIFMTSRRGPRGLTKVDDLYVHYLRRQGIQVEVIAADAISKEHTAAVIEQAKQAGPIGGIFVMTVVLRDAKFTNLTQQSFDEVYQSKVAVLNTLLSCVDPSTLDFMLLFSTIGSVFGNAGQAAYCASQL